MKLHVRLTLVSMSMVLLFLATFFFTWSLIGGHQMMRPPKNGMSAQLFREASRVYQEGGWTALETSLRWNLHPTLCTTVYGLDGRERLTFGEKSPPEPRFFQETLARGSGEHMDLSGLEIWARVDGREGPVAVLRQVLPPFNHDDQRWQFAYTMVTAAGAAALVCLLAGFWASRAIARPVSDLVLATQALSRSDFHHRITPKQGGELRELAESFNLMAGHLEDTVTSLIEAKEKAERSEASRRQFMSDVSHNLRTPLAAMLGWSEALLDGLAPGEEKLHLRNIRDQTTFVAKNIQRLTDWSRWEGQELELKLEAFPVSEPLMDCLQTLEEVAQHKEIDLELSGLAEEPRVRADRIRIRELFQVLLENAIYHNEPGCHLKVEFCRAQDRLLVTISDTGAGLPEELRRDLECRVGGGLGLAIAARLARAHGGELQILEGPGSRLRFSLESDVD